MTKQQLEMGEIPLLNISADIEQFVEDLESLRSTFLLVMETASSSITAKALALDEFFKERASEVKDADGGVKYQVPAEYASDMIQRSKELRKAVNGFNTIPQSFIVALISKYDFFLGRLTKQLFLHKPELCATIEKKIDFSDLLEFESMQSAKEFLLDKEVESLLRKSHTEQFEWLAKKFSIKLKVGLDIWPQFVELTERRNLFAHCNGIVSDQYLNVCAKHGVSIDPNEVKIGTKLYVTPEYFNHSYECILEVGVKLSQVLWRKTLPSQVDSADRSFMEITFELLCTEQYPLVIMFHDFAHKYINKFSNDEAKKMVLVNLALAHKWSGDNATAFRIIKSEDWSACSNRFKIAEAVVLDDFIKASKIMKAIGQNDEIRKSEYRNWPLFLEYRKTDTFLETYEEVFGKPFLLVDRPTLSKSGKEFD
jgi:hypothetical protein